MQKSAINATKINIDFISKKINNLFIIRDKVMIFYDTLRYVFIQKALILETLTKYI